MTPVSDRFLRALRSSHAATISATLTRPASDPVDLDIVGGQVEVDAGSRTRRRCIVEVPADPAVYAAFGEPGARLLPRRGIRFADGTTEDVPLGVFVLDEESITYAPGGRIQAAGADQWVSVERARFEIPETTTGPNITEALRLVEDAIPGVTVENRATSTSTARPAVWERDRDDAVEQLAAAAAAEVYFDATGAVVARDVPSITDPDVWLIDASASGVLLTATRARGRRGVYNVVVVVPTATDGVPPFAPVVVEDDDPTSPTYVTTYGRVPRFYASPLVTTTGQATAAGQALLRRVKAPTARLTAESVVNPALDAGDVITVLLPDEAIERHLVVSVTVPLDVDTPQRVTTYSPDPGDLPSEPS